jgi:hypothetical protein
MGFRDRTTWKVQPITISYIPIDRTYRDLSNGICFTVGTHCRMNQRIEYLGVNFCLIGFRDPTIRKVPPITINYIPIDRTHRDLSNDVSTVYSTCSGIPYRGTYSTVTYI